MVEESHTSLTSASAAAGAVAQRDHGASNARVLVASKLRSHVKGARWESVFCLLNEHGVISQFKSTRTPPLEMRPERMAPVLFLLFPETKNVGFNTSNWVPSLELLVGVHVEDGDGGKQEPWRLRAETVAEYFEWLNALWCAASTQDHGPGGAQAVALRLHCGGSGMKAVGLAAGRRIVRSGDSIKHRKAKGGGPLFSPTPTTRRLGGAPAVISCPPSPATQLGGDMAAAAPMSSRRVRFAENASIFKFQVESRKTRKLLFYTAGDVEMARREASRSFDIARARAAEWLRFFCRRKGQQVVPELPPLF